MKKIVILVGIVFLLSGCNITYNLEINNQEFKENIKIVENNKEAWNLPLSVLTVEEFYEHYKDKPIPISVNSPIVSESNEKLNDVQYYKKKNLTSEDSLGLSYKYDMTQSQFNDSFFIHYAYNRFLVGTVDDHIIISTGENFKLYEQYNNLDKVTVNIKTNHKVIDNNADEINGDTYTWNITKRNASNKSIYLEIEKDQLVDNEGNSFLGVVIIIFFIIVGIIVVSILSYYYLKHKQRKSNEF